MGRKRCNACHGMGACDLCYGRTAIESLRIENETLKTANEGLLQKLAMLKERIEGNQELLDGPIDCLSVEDVEHEFDENKKALTATEADVKAWLAKQHDECLDDAISINKSWNEQKGRADKLEAALVEKEERIKELKSKL